MTSEWLVHPIQPCVLYTSSELPWEFNISQLGDRVICLFVVLNLHRNVGFLAPAPSTVGTR